MVKALILVLSGILALTIQMIYYIKDDRTVNTDPKDKRLKLRWHIAGGAIHVWMYYTITAIHGPLWGLLMASLTWLVFDGAVNSYALGKEFFYIGNTALLDKAQQWTGKKIGVDPRLLSGVLKLSFLALTLFLLFKKYANG